MKARRKWLSIKNKTAETIVYALSSLSAQTGKKKPKTNSKESQMKKNGGVKMLMTKRYIQTRSNDQHRLLLLTEVKTKEYRHSECMENITCTEISK